MSLTELLERISSRQHKRDEQRRVDYHDLVLNVAGGKEPAEDVVDQVLRETGKTVDQFGQDVEVMAKRLKWRETLDRRGPLHREQEEIQKKIAKADAVLDEAEKKHDNAVQPLIYRMISVKQALRECDEAERSLRDTCLDGVLLAELADVVSRTKDASKRRSELLDEIRSLREWSASDAVGAEQAPFRGHAEELRERSQQRMERADSLERKLADVEQSMADLRRREETLRDRLLLP
jgi:uncharacterized protein YoxC